MVEVGSLVEGEGRDRPGVLRCVMTGCLWISPDLYGASLRLAGMGVLLRRGTVMTLSAVSLEKRTVRLLRLLLLLAHVVPLPAEEH